jgi:hypothetical protein
MKLADHRRITVLADHRQTTIELALKRKSKRRAEPIPKGKPVRRFLFGRVHAGPGARYFAVSRAMANPPARTEMAPQMT